MARRLLRWGALGLVAVLAVAVVLYIARERTLLPWAVRYARGWVARELGAELEIEAVHSDLWSHVSIEGARWSCSAPEVPLRELAARELTLEFDLSALLRGDLGGLKRIAGEVGRVELDTRVAAPQTTQAPAGAPLELPHFPPTVDVRVQSLTVLLAGDDAVSAQDARLAVGPAGRIELEAGELALRTAGVEHAGALSLAADYSHRGTGADAHTRLGLEHLRWGELELRDGSIAGSLSPPMELQLETAWGAAEGAGHLTAALADGRCTGELRCDSLALESVVRLLPEAAAREIGSLAGHFAGTLDFELALAAPQDARAALAFEVQDLSLREARVARVLAQVQLERGALRAGEILLEDGADRMHLSDVALASFAGQPWDWLSNAKASLSVSLSEPDTLGLLASLIAPSGAGAITLLELEAGLDRGELRLERAQVASPSGRVHADRGILKLAPTLERWAEASEAEVDLSVQLADVRDLNAFIGALDWSGALAGRVEVRGTPAAPAGSINASATDLFVGGYPLGAVQVRADADGRAFVVREARADGELMLLDATAAWDFRQRKWTRIDGTATLRALERVGVADLEAGELDCSVSASGPMDALRGRAELRGRGVRAYGTDFDALEVDAHFAGASLRAGRCLVRTPEGTLRGAGEFALEADGWRATLTKLVAERAGETLVLEDELRARGSASAWSVEPFRLAGSVGGASGSADFAAGELEARVALEQFDPMPLLQAGLPPGLVVRGLDGELELRRAAGSERWAVDLKLAELRPSAQASTWSAVLAGTWESGVVDVRECVVESAQVGKVRASARAPLDWNGGWVLGQGPVALDLSARLDVSELPSEQLPLMGSATVEAAIEGDWDLLTGTLDVRGQRLLVRSTKNSFGPARVLLTLDLGERAQVREGRIVSDQISLDLTGGIGLLKPREFLDGSAAAWLARPLDLQADFKVTDPSWLAEWSGALQRLEGSCSGQVLLRGELGQPEVSGRMNVADVSARIGTDLPLLEQVSGSVVLEGAQLALEGVRGEFGAAPFELGGSYSWAGGVPSVDLWTKGRDVLLARSRGTLVRADVDIAVKGKIGEGPDEKLRASGEVTLTDGRWVKSIDLLGDLLRGGSAAPSVQRGLEFSISRDAPISDMELDVAVRSREPFVLKNNLVSGSARPDLRLRGTGEVPYLVGKIYLDPTRLSLPSGHLNVSSGTLEFDESNTSVPTLALTGQTRVKGYNLEVQLTGNLAEADVRVTATPPLSNEEAVVLLLTGQLPESASSAAAGRAVAVYFAQDVLSRWLADESTNADESFFDRLEIDIGSDISRGGSETMHVMYRLNALPDNPEGTGRVRYLTAEQDIYDKVNFGYRFLFRSR